MRGEGACDFFQKTIAMCMNTLSKKIDHSLISSIQITLMFAKRLHNHQLDCPYASISTEMTLEIIMKHNNSFFIAK